MNRYFRLHAWLLAFLIGVAPALAQNIPGNAALVNGEPITNFRLERHLEEDMKSKKRNLTAMINPKAYKKLKKEALDQLIEREILWQAARGAGVTVSDEELKAAMKQLEASFKTREAYLRKLDHNGFDEKSYGEYVRQDLVVTRYLSDAAGTPTVTDEEIAAYYKENPGSFGRPEMVRARHILIKVPKDAPVPEREAARQRLESIREEALKGADFADLARRYSQDTSASDGGDLGKFGRGRMVKPFENAAFALKPGEISEIVETPYGFHIIRVDEREDAKTLTLEESKERIREALTVHKRAVATKEIKARLQAAAKIQVFVHLTD